ncbi:hypothetical protein CMI38_07185 [Candidatus Pacearchaeota archaeon]|jgi:hypothetical protein|nr:hypothetical protein [Candidatus Pacearchaeota archaeon]|tara:strand:- start:1253 stop:1606 length:354 start_codon:yes stop_codon:yes gene_type:complete
MTEYFIILDTGGYIRYSFMKKRKSFVSVTVYFQNSFPEHIEYDLKKCCFRDYEGYKRPRKKFRKGAKKRQDELRSDFIELLSIFLENKNKIELREGRYEIEKIIKELYRISHEIKNG